MSGLTDGELGGAATDVPAVRGNPEGRAEFERRPPRDPVVWLLGLLALLVLGYFLWWIATPGDTQLINRFTLAVAVPGGLLAIVLAFRIRRARWLDPKTRRAWAMLGLAFCSYTAAALIRFAGTDLPDAGPLTAAAPALEIAACVFATAGLAMLPSAPRSRSDTILFALDVAIVAWVAAMLLWHFLFFPVAREAGADTIATVLAAWHPVADLAFIFAVAAILLRGRRPSSQAALTAFGLALLLLFAGDTIQAVESLRGISKPGGLSGILYASAWVAMALAAFLQSRPDDWEPHVGFGIARWHALWWLPYAAVAVAFIVPVFRDWYDMDLLRQHVPATGLLMALVVARLAVTARQNAGLAAAERERLAAAVHQAAESMMMTDRAGKIEYVNPAFTRITGYTAADAIGRNAQFLIEGTADPDRLAEVRAALGRDEVWGGRLRYLRQDGSAVDVDLTVSPLRDGSGAVVGSIEVARDISRETALEAQLVEAQRMEAVGRLAGGIAHDFNNLLTVISGFGQLASAEVASGDPVAADLAEILKASDRAAALIRALLAFSRRQVLQPSVLDLNQVVSGISPMLARLIGEDVELVVHSDPELRCTLADRGQLEQVVMNLVVNARDAMPGGGRLTIETANVDLDAEYARTHVGAAVGPHVMLAVSDTGVGMTTEVMEHAFEPFFTTKPHGKGTGLGLSTVIGIVQQSGGTIHVVSKPGRGTAFKIYLPRVEPQSEPIPTAAPHSDSPRGDETILVAEDERAVRVFVERVLTRAGYRVLTAANGAEAIALAASYDGEIHLLVTDVVMPNMLGKEVAEQIRQLRSEIEVLYMSGYARPVLASGGRLNPNVSLIEKPFTAAELIDRAGQILNGHFSGFHTVEGARAPTPTPPTPMPMPMPMPMPTPTPTLTAEQQR